MTVEISKLIDILYTSEILHNLIPKVRRITLIETLYACKNKEGALNIFLENLSSSPYIPENNKNQFAELIFNNKLDLLKQLLNCKKRRIKCNRLVSFKKMVLSIFIKSNKIKRLEPRKKKYLGVCITHSLSVDELKQLTINSLETSEIFNDREKELVANDIFDNRFDLLLLPDRFDCEESKRVNETINNIELDECPICLGSSYATIKLPCQHLFCQECIKKWAEQSNNSDCPLCRQSFNLENLYI